MGGLSPVNKLYTCGRLVRHKLSEAASQAQKRGEALMAKRWRELHESAVK